ncbi:hypothetical protein SCP_0406290 [Sparassis crispa]|uniref:SPIN90/Ldb17 leucine-rich domain-containing protein n=1 Tax=Sparassis crispa TaxID=139825 RepID=A0A401GJA9_9APHY|nr:hypothetical protein SCP_0406290 [Sparassis crispa]GBE82245.1 hypothetical protein SCP_0406290 [Sparassis crispa]
MTFSENMIFMHNCTDRTPEALCMQVLMLKILYLLFMMKGVAEYFYTNDLCVLVDVFLREIGNINEDNESIRLPTSWWLPPRAALAAHEDAAAHDTIEAHADRALAQGTVPQHHITAEREDIKARKYSQTADPPFPSIIG